MTRIAILLLVVLAALARSARPLPGLKATEQGHGIIDAALLVGYAVL